MKHIFRYLRGTKSMQMIFGSNHPTKGEGLTNSDYVGNLDNRKSTSGYVFTYGGGAISWRSKLQECTTLSTTKAKYIVTLEAAMEAIWLQRLLADFSAKRQIVQNTPALYCDLQSAIHLGFLCRAPFITQRRST